MSRVGGIAAATCMAMLLASSASAQVFGTFSWQMQPYCNRVTLTLTSLTGNFTLDGFDDQCGAQNKASAVGVGTFNAAGEVTLNLTIVTAPGGKPVHVSAVVSPANGNGTWIDSIGNKGTFVMGGAVPGLQKRALPASGVAPESITANDLAPAAVTASRIASGAVGASKITSGAIRASHLGPINTRSNVSAVIAPGDLGSVTAECEEGEVVLSGGNTNALDVFVVVSRRGPSNDWIVFGRNTGTVNRTLTAHAYCLAPAFQ